MGKPVVQITLEAWHKIRGYILASDIECSMLAEVETKNNRFIISKVYLPKQTRSAAFTKITHDGVAELLLTEGIDPAKIKAWFHSHVNMGVTPSGTDKAQAQELMADADWFIRGIFNKKGEYSMHVHWMGIEVEAEMQISYDDAYDIPAIRAELDAVTVTEVCNSGTAYSRYDADDYFPKGKRKKGRDTAFPTTCYGFKIQAATHRLQNKYLSDETLKLYEEIEEAPTFSAFMWRGFREWVNSSKKSDLEYFAALYDEFLSGLNFGYEEGYCYRYAQQTLYNDQELQRTQEKAAEKLASIAGVT